MDILENEPMTETKIMAHTAYLLFRSSLDQFRFYRARHDTDTEKMLKNATCELENATRMLNLMLEDPAVGFEAANHYYFSRGQMAEKILNCDPDIVISEFEDVDKSNALQEQLGVPVITLSAGSQGVFDEKYGAKKVVLQKEDIIEYFDTEHHRYMQGACAHGQRP